MSWLSEAPCYYVQAVSSCAVYLVPSAPGRCAGGGRRRGPSPLLGPGHALSHQHVVQAHQLRVGRVAKVVLKDGGETLYICETGLPRFKKVSRPFKKIFIHFPRFKKVLRSFLNKYLFDHTWEKLTIFNDFYPPPPRQKKCIFGKLVPKIWQNSTNFSVA